MNYQVSFLVAGMLITGCANSILNKLQDNTCVANCDGPPKEREHFEQPVFQTVQMFIAEACCWFCWLAMRRYSSRRRYQQLQDDDDDDDYDDGIDDANSAESSVDNTNAPRQPKLLGQKLLLLAFPAFFDICGTTLMNVGLLYVPVSIYQMIRGALVLFVGFMSIVFLKHKITVVQWWGLTAVTLGVFLVGLSARFAASSRQNVISEGLEKTPVQVTMGIFMVLFAQIFTASQFVAEEYILNRYSMEPIKVVSWEGTFGAGITVVGSTIIYALIHGHSSYDTMFNLYTSTVQVLNNQRLVISGIAIMVSIAGFNFFGLTVTRTLSATSRSTVDTCRTIGIWFVSYLLGWEGFQVLQLAGFGFLVYGTMMFNGIVHQDLSKPEDELSEERARQE